jgi:hypothetical protein
MIVKTGYAENTEPRLARSIPQNIASSPVTRSLTGTAYLFVGYALENAAGWGPHLRPAYK